MTTYCVGVASVHAYRVMSAGVYRVLYPRGHSGHDVTQCVVCSGSLCVGGVLFGFMLESPGYVFQDSKILLSMKVRRHVDRGIGALILTIIRAEQIGHNASG